MSEPAKYKKITDFTPFEENPFVEKAINDIRIVKRTQVVRPKNRDEIQQITSSDGEVTGYTAFLRFIEVDEDKFAKVHLSQFASFWDLSKPAIRVFGYILNVLRPKQTSFDFDMNKCLAYTKYSTEKSVFDGLAVLIECSIIARSNRHYRYFINPLVVFNGDRVAFSKMYVKKKKMGQNQGPNLFQDQIQDFENEQGSQLKQGENSIETPTENTLNSNIIPGLTPERLEWLREIVEANTVQISIVGLFTCSFHAIVQLINTLSP